MSTLNISMTPASCSRREVRRVVISILLYRALDACAAAWKLYEENKDSVSWDLSVLHPGWVFGVSPHQPHLK